MEDLESGISRQDQGIWLSKLFMGWELVFKFVDTFRYPPGLNIRIIIEIVPRLKPGE